MHRLSRVVALLFVFVLVAGGPLAVRAQDLDRDEQNGTLDLSAMMLTPLDLAEEGLEGYSLAWGGTDTLDEEYANLISGEEMTPDETLDVLEDAGFVQSRWQYMDLPTEDDPDFAARRVAVIIDEFTESDGLSGVMDTFYAGEALEGDDAIGDDTRTTSYTDTDPDTGIEVTALVIAFRYDNLIGQINISDYLTQLPDEEPTVEEITALAERLLKRIETVVEDGSAGIDHQMLRFESDGEMVSYNADYYTRLDDELLPRYGQDDDMLAEIDDAEQSFGMTDAYRVVQTIGSNGETFIAWGAQVRLFDDQDGAADWVASAADWLEISGAEEVEEIDADLSMGGETTVVTYRSGSEDAPFYTVAVFVQVGETGILTQISYPGELPDVDVVAELAELQVACVEDSCPVESPLPDSLIELAETLS